MRVLMRRALLLLFPLVAAMAAGGCKNVKQGAREHFSKDFSCPMERVEVRHREDLKRSDFEDRATPSKEIAADPERLQMWQSEQNKNLRYMDDHDEIIEARGCEQQTLYACHRHNKDANYIMCSAKPYRDGMAKW